MHEAEVPGAVIRSAECGDGTERVSSDRSCMTALAKASASGSGG